MPDEYSAMLDRARNGLGITALNAQHLMVEYDRLARIAWAAVDYRAVTAHRGPEANELDAALDAWREADA
jgi:hypothetical protein